MTTEPTTDDDRIRRALVAGLRWDLDRAGEALARISSAQADGDDLSLVVAPLAAVPEQRWRRAGADLPDPTDPFGSTVAPWWHLHKSRDDAHRLVGAPWQVAGLRVESGRVTTWVDFDQRPPATLGRWGRLEPADLVAELRHRPRAPHLVPGWMVVELAVAGFWDLAHDRPAWDDALHPSAPRTPRAEADAAVAGRPAVSRHLFGPAGPPEGLRLPDGAATDLLAPVRVPQPDRLAAWEVLDLPEPPDLPAGTGGLERWQHLAAQYPDLLTVTPGSPCPTVAVRDLELIWPADPVPDVPVPVAGHDRRTLGLREGSTGLVAVSDDGTVGDPRLDLDALLVVSAYWFARVAPTVIRDAHAGASFDGDTDVQPDHVTAALPDLVCSTMTDLLIQLADLAPAG